MVKDYYQILSVPKDANEDQIKKSYRSLAQEWHPDKHTQDKGKQREAEEKFKEISEAYAVLSDPEQKANYDLTGDPTRGGMPSGFRMTGDPGEIFFHRFRQQFRNAGPAVPPPMKGQSLQQNLDVSLQEALFGGERTFNYSVTSSCETCEGRGGTEFKICSVCKGAGMHVRQEPNMIIQTSCEPCGGQGQAIKTICDRCQGRCVEHQEKTLHVKIPVGLRHGTTLRLAGEGGRGFNGGSPGDILLAINLNYPDISQLTEDERNQLEKLLSK